MKELLGKEFFFLLKKWCLVSVFLFLLDITVSGNDTWTLGSHLCNPTGDVLLRKKPHLEDGRGERWKEPGSWGWVDQHWKQPTSRLLMKHTSLLFKPVESGYLPACSRSHHDWYAKERRRQFLYFMASGLLARHQSMPIIGLNLGIALYLITGTFYFFNLHKEENFT